MKKEMINALYDLVNRLDRGEEIPEKLIKDCKKYVEREREISFARAHRQNEFFQRRKV